MDKDAAQLLDKDQRLVLQIKKGGLMKQGGDVEAVFEKLDGDHMIVKVETRIKVPLADIGRYRRWERKAQPGMDEITPSRVRLIPPAYKELAKEQGAL